MLLKNKRYSVTSAKRFLYKSLVNDKRCKFRDLSQFKEDNRFPEHSILQIYDNIDNIGNFLPVLGIRKMLGSCPDTWDIHHREIDFDFINQNYKGVIIGGAGLLCLPFKDFWLKFLQECKLPTVIWGVGTGFGIGIGERINKHQLYERDKEYIQAVRKVSQRCDLINVRDKLTANYFQLEAAQITACPTIVYMKEHKGNLKKDSHQILFSSHNNDSKSELIKIKNDISQVNFNFQFTDNVQHPYIGLKEIIDKYYVNSKLIVTTRLHGAIMAYGLNIPYIGITRGEKTRSFCQEYGNGILVQDLNELTSVLKKTLADGINMQPIKLEEVLDFGTQVKQWISSLDSKNF